VGWIIVPLKLDGWVSHLKNLSTFMSEREPLAEGTMDRIPNIEGKLRPIGISLGFVLIGTVGILDFLTGYEVSFSLFYVIPISSVTWLVGRQSGLIASLISACVWFAADAATGHSYSGHLIPIWNTLIRLSFFVIVTLLLSALKTAMQREKELARTDNLTGAVNSRLFFQLAQMEIDRLQRYEHPLTLAYIDLDDFKAVNDRFGHATGDEALRTVVSCAKRVLRRTDVIARLGGDEFAVLLPETNGEAARLAIPKLQRSLTKEMRFNNWPITFSIGVLTCNASPGTPDELLRMADEAMYSAKREDKNAVNYSMYPPQ
jgi:diguanylate cyclase (GGDEF)-like protein